MSNTRQILLATVCLFLFAGPLRTAEKIKVLLIDGQNNHDWKHTTPVLKWTLESCGRFTVDVSTTPPSAPREPQSPKANATAEQKAAHENAVAKWKLEKARTEKDNAAAWAQWHPKFSDYGVVVSNYNGEDWPEQVRTEFVEYIRNGGGLVSVHAADNSFPNWTEYNQMIGVGGWGGRNEKNGPMVRFRDGKFVHDEQPGAGGAHGAQHEFLVETRDAEHPIMKGLPTKWMAASDELYSKLRGPAENMTVLATAYSAPDTHGTGENEPILMVINFGKGRVFHTTLGHSVKALEGLGDQVTLQRGTEWAATGNVTLPLPPEGALKADHAALNPPPGSITEPAKTDASDPYAKATALAAKYQRAGKLDDALRIYAEQLDHKKDERIYNSMGQIFAWQKKPEKAMEMFHEALKLNPRFLPAKLNLANSLFDSGKLPEAATQLKEVIAIDPNNFAAYVIDASMQLRMKDFSGAEKSCKDALYLNPKSAEAWNDLGVAQFLQAHVDSATESFDKAIALKPDYEDARTNLEKARRKMASAER